MDQCGKLHWVVQNPFVYSMIITRVFAVSTFSIREWDEGEDKRIFAFAKTSIGNMWKLWWQMGRGESMTTWQCWCEEGFGWSRHWSPHNSTLHTGKMTSLNVWIVLLSNQLWQCCTPETFSLGCEAEAVNSAVYKLNCTGESHVDNKTPNEVWYGKAAKFDHWRVFSIECS